MARVPVVLALLVVAAALAPAASAGTFRTHGTPYVAETLWSAKRAVGLDTFVLTGRPPWDQEPTGRDVTVGIVDTGIDPSHPDLDDKRIRWRDFVDGRRRAYDDQGHGTHVAGLVAAEGHPQVDVTSPYLGFGARGIAPDADLLIAKAVGADGKGDDARVAEAIRWLVDPNGDGDLGDGADVINLSLGIGDPRGDDATTLTGSMGSATRKAVQEAIKRGVVVVVSSGNGGVSTVSDPGDLDPVVTVGATDGEGEVTDFSNYGRYLDVAAPGILVSTYPTHLDVQDGDQDGYVGLAGTSMAAPVVAGVAALAMEADPALQEKSATRDMTGKVERVQEILRTHANPPEGAGEEASFGVVDAHGSLLAVDQGADGLDGRAVAALILVAGLVAYGGLGLVRRVRSEPDAPSRDPVETSPGDRRG